MTASTCSLCPHLTFENRQEERMGFPEPVLTLLPNHFQLGQSELVFPVLRLLL